MANGVFNGYKAACMGIVTSGTPVARVDVIADTVKVLLVTSAYTFNADDRFVTTAASAEISVTGYTGGFGGAGRKSLASRTLAADDTNDYGKFSAANLTWTALGTGATIAAAIVFKELTSDALSPMIAYFDVTDTPTNGGDITLQWDGTNGILTLS